MFRNKKFPIRRRQIADATRQFVSSTPLSIEEIERAMRMGTPDTEFDSGDETFDVVSDENDEKLIADCDRIIADNTRPSVDMSVEIEKVMVDDISSTKTTTTTDKPTENGNPQTVEQTKGLPKIHITNKTLPSADSPIPPPQTLNNTTLDASSTSSLNSTSSMATSETDDSETARKRRERTKKRNEQKKESNRRKWEEKNAAAKQNDSLQSEVARLKALLAAKEGPGDAGIAPGSRPDPPKPSNNAVSSPPDPDAREASGSAVSNGSNRGPRVGEIPRQATPNRIARMHTGPRNQYDRRFALPPPVDSRPPPPPPRAEPFEGVNHGGSQPMVAPRIPKITSTLPRHSQMGRPQELSRSRQDAASAGIPKLEERPSALQEAAKDFVRIIDGKIKDIHAKWKMHQGSADSLKKQLDELHHE